MGLLRSSNQLYPSKCDATNLRVLKNVKCSESCSCMTWQNNLVNMIPNVKLNRELGRYFVYVV